MLMMAWAFGNRTSPTLRTILLTGKLATITSSGTNLKKTDVSVTEAKDSFLLCRSRRVCGNLRLQEYDAQSNSEIVAFGAYS